MPITGTALGLSRRQRPRAWTAGSGRAAATCSCSSGVAVDAVGAVKTLDLAWQSFGKASSDEAARWDMAAASAEARPVSA